MAKVKITAELSPAAPLPEAVRLEVTQGPHTLRSVDVPADAPEAVVDLDDGDYTVRATALVPHGTPAEAALAVPVRVVVTPA